MLDYIASILVRILNRLFSVVPISASLWLGRQIGSLWFFFNKKRRVITYANLKAAFAKEKTPAQLRCITKRVYQNLAQTFVEIINLTKVNKSYTNKYVEVVNMERIENAARSGRGTILLTAHFGDWELSNLVSAMVGFPILVLVREQKAKHLNELLNQLRESKGCKVVRKGISTKNILRALYERQIVGILSDQDAGRQGLFVDFFGRPTSTHIGPWEMAKRTDSIILPNFIVRQRGPYHKLYLEEYLDFRDSKSGGDIKEYAQRYASLLEGYIRRYPDQWLWLHKRWKSTPVRTVLILNDGRAGHLNQSLAVAKEIRKARSSQGYGLDDTKIVVVDVKFKSAFLKTALSFCVAFASWRCHGCMRCMRLCLERRTYQTLMQTYAEFVISCGSGIAPVNVFMARENNAKNIVIMKPAMPVSIRQFDLALIPKHDMQLKRKNVVTTSIAPNMIDEDVLRRDGEKLKARVRLEKKLTLGVLMGGDNPEFTLTARIAREVAEAVLKIAERHDGDILVTTSRRTSREAGDILKETLAKSSRCKLLVIANEKNIDEAIGGILGLSDVVLVSAESISMVSEAVASGKKTVAFELEKKIGRMTKHEMTLRDLERQGYIAVSKSGELTEKLEKVLQDNTRPPELRERERIFEAARRLV